MTLNRKFVLDNRPQGEATASNTASKKNNSEVTYSGTTPVAHNPTVNNISAAACITNGVAPAGGGKKKITTEAMLASKARRVDRRGIAQVGPCATASSARTAARDVDAMLPPMHTTTGLCNTPAAASKTLH